MFRRSNRFHVTMAVFVVVVLGLANSAGFAANRPNIILVFIDDMGWGGLFLLWI